MGAPIRADGDRLLARAQGFKWETLNRQGGGGGIALTSGTQYYMLVPLFADETITAIGMDVTSGGTSLTLVKLGLISPGGGVLASTGDVKASFTGAGFQAPAFSTPYTPATDGAAYASVICTHTGTAFNAIRSQNSFTPADTPTNVWISGTRASLSDLSASGPNSRSGSPNYYMALV